MALFRRLSKRNRILKNDGIMPLPKKLTFEPTLACNLTCTMCDRYETPTKYNVKYMGFDDIKKIVESLPKTINEVYIVGGEPLIRNDIVEICKEFLRRGIKVMIQTNGTFVDAAMELSDINDVKVIFSLDGTADVHNRIRGQPNVYEKNLGIYHKYVENKKSIVITSVITDENLAVLKELVKMLVDEGVKPSFLIVELARRYTKELVNESAELMQIHPWEIPIRLKESSLPPYSFENFKKNIAELDDILKKYRYKYCYYPRNLINNLKDFYYRDYRRNNELYCTHLDELRIDSKGNVIYCHVFRRSFGNMLERPIEDIWNSKEFCEFRVRLIKNNLTPVCETCYRAKNDAFFDNSFIKTSELLSTVKT